MVRSLLFFSAVVLSAASARADHVYLLTGDSFEGKTTVAGDKVSVEMESGRITLPMSEVARIEKGTTPLAQVSAREAALKPGDTQGMLALANYCREHDLYNKERELLQRILTVAPDHAEARRRLGFVQKDVNGRQVWVEKAQTSQGTDTLRAEARHAQVVAMQKQADADAAAVMAQREKARNAEEQAQRQRDNGLYALRPYYTQPGYGYGYGYGSYGYGGYGYGGYGAARYGYGYGHLPHLSAPNGPPAFGINGVRPPSDTGWMLNGVRSPQSYFDNGPHHRH